MNLDNTTWIDLVHAILWSDAEWRKADALPWGKVEEVLEKAHSLLQRAALETDNEILHDEIMEFISGRMKSASVQASMEVISEEDAKEFMGI